jgi:hypothetical protein
MTKLAYLISKMEGYGIPGAIPTTHNNMGDLRHSPHSQHPGDPNAIGVIDTIAHGWEDLERQLQIYANEGLTLQQMVALYAPPTENNTSNYLTFVCNGLGMTPDVKVSEALKEISLV